MQQLIKSFLITTLAMISSPALANEVQPKLSSSQNRESRSYAVVFHAPTLTMGEVSSGEAGVQMEKFLSSRETIHASLLQGVAGHLGHSAGQGEATRLSVGFRQFFGNSFYLSPGLSLRHLEVGTISMRETDDGSGSTVYVGEKVGDARVTTLGANCATGFLWQHRRITIGIELASVFLPVAVVEAKGQSSDPSTSNDSAERKALSIGRSIDLTIPRFVLGFAW